MFKYYEECDGCGKRLEYSKIHITIGRVTTGKNKDVELDGMDFCSIECMSSKIRKVTGVRN